MVSTAPQQSLVYEYIFYAKKKISLINIQTDIYQKHAYGCVLALVCVYVCAYIYIFLLHSSLKILDMNWKHKLKYNYQQG